MFAELGGNGENNGKKKCHVNRYFINYTLNGVNIVSRSIRPGEQMPRVNSTVRLLLLLFSHDGHSDPSEQRSHTRTILIFDGRV